MCDNTPEWQHVEEYKSTLEGTFNVSEEFVKRHQRSVGVIQYEVNGIQDYNQLPVVADHQCSGTLFGDGYF